MSRRSAEGRSSEGGLEGGKAGEGRGQLMEGS